VIFLIVCVQVNDLSGDNNPQGCPKGHPEWVGWKNVSKKSEIFCFFCFESTRKKKRFEKRPNVCKWLKILLNSFSQHPGEHFKLFRSILALKLTELKVFEISNIFGSSSFGRRPKNIEEILSNGCRTAHFSLENFKKVTFWLKSLFSK
jgi:hypothetical protein